MRLSLACAPCPNATFMFGTLAEGTLEAPEIELEVTLDDVEALNLAALAGTHRLTKLSAAAYLRLQDRNQALQGEQRLDGARSRLVVSREPSVGRGSRNSVWLFRASNDGAPPVPRLGAARCEGG